MTVLLLRLRGGFVVDVIRKNIPECVISGSPQINMTLAGLSIIKERNLEKAQLLYFTPKPKKFNTGSFDPSKIDLKKFYHFSEIVKLCNVSIRKLYNDKKNGDLIVCTNRSTHVRGDWVIAYWKKQQNNF